MIDAEPAAPAGSGLHGRLAARWAEAPDALALVADGEPFTRRALAAATDSVERELRGRGLVAGQCVGWLGLNSARMLVTLVACARIGLVFVPLNTRLVPAELEALVRHAGLALLLGDEAMVAAVGARVAWPVADASGRMAPGDALLVYTSGTTGEPKGAVHTHAGMLANLDAATAVQGLTDADRVLAVLPLFHVGGLCIQTLPALAAGAVVHLLRHFQPAEWLQLVAEWRPTTSLLVPAVMRAIVRHPDFGATDLSGLRFLNSGSQIVPLDLIEAFHARGVPVAQVYGGTETGPFSIALRPEAARAEAGRCGWPAPGVEVQLVRADGAPAAPGEAGEVRLRARNLMRGYHRQPPDAGFVDGWFATGDLAVADERGCHTLVGRTRELIISGGENVHPAEIEHLALAFPGVAEAAVVGVPDARWGEVPLLVVVPAAGAEIDCAALRASFEGRIARYKHPREVVVRLALPRTALGKVRKDALRAELAAGPG